VQANAPFIESWFTMFGIENLPEWKLGYIAGILDGEGSILLLRSSCRARIYPRVVVGMSDHVCVGTLQNITSVGHVYTVEYKKKNCKSIYTWNVQAVLEIYFLLKAVLPYLITKKERAKVMIDFVERRIQNIPQGSYDEELRRKLRELNK